MGLGSTTAKVISHEKFLEDPTIASKDVWEASKGTIAPNGAIMRTSILGCFEFDDLSKVKANAERICKVTHYDSRCVASCIAVCVSIALLLQGRSIDKENEIHAFVDEVIAHCDPYLVGKEKREDFLKYFVRDSSPQTLEKLHLDDSSSIGYTLKAMGSGFYCLFSNRSFEETLNSLVKEGGDADS